MANKKVTLKDVWNQAVKSGYEDAELILCDGSVLRNPIFKHWCMADFKTNTKVVEFKNVYDKNYDWDD